MYNFSFTVKQDFEEEEEEVNSRVCNVMWFTGRIGFRYLKKKENHEYSEPNGIAFWHDIINGAFSGIVAHRLNSYLTVALRVDGNFSSKERKAKWCCTFVGLHSKFLINQYPILVKSTFFISKEKSSSGLNIFLGTRFKNGLGVGLMTSLTRDTASLGTFFDLDLAWTFSRYFDLYQTS